jgi:diacylglycerol O-acyltransferase / wax synthase
VHLLTGADAFQLYAESPVQPMHTLKVVLLDPVGARRAPTVEGMADWLQSAVSRVPPLRWRLVTAPLHYGGYGWVEDGSIDVAAHLHSARLDTPGDRATLDAFCGRLMGERLDRSRPLWELWVVDGLADGRIAHVWKQHHALADGLSSVRLLDEIYQHAPDENAPPAAPPTGSEPVTTRVGVGVGLRQHGRLARNFPRLVLRSRRARSVAVVRRRAGLPASARSRTGPGTRFNTGLTSQRCCTSVTLPLADLKSVAKASNTTLNDVYVAVVAGALRDHLAAHDELPTSPLTATLPVSTRTPEEEAAYGNRVGVWYLPLPTNVPDPAERLKAAHISTRGARETATESGAHRLLTEWQLYSLLFRPFNVMANRLRISRAGRRMLRPLFNLTVSNVRGPGRLYADGAEVVEIASMSVLSMGQGLNLTGWSYGADFTIGLVSCPESDPDLPHLAERLVSALAELVTATGVAAAQAPAPLIQEA